MSTFDFNEVKERKSFVGYGINHSVTIIGVENGLSTNGNPFIQINFKNTGDGDDNATIQKLYMSDRAKNITMSKIMTIHSAVAKIEQLKNQKFNSIEELTSGLNSMWSGRKFRLKLQASEYLGEDKEGNEKIKIRTEIPMRDFAEAIDTGAEMFPIKDEDTQLKFDEKDKWDFKRYDGAPPTPKTDGGSEDSLKKDDLPF